MRTRAQITNPDDVMVEVTISLPLKYWRLLREQIPFAQGWPASEFRDRIREVINKIERTVDSNLLEPDEASDG